MGATISTGMIGQGVVNFGPFFGVLAAMLATLLVVVGAQVLESGGRTVGGGQRGKWIGYGAVVMAGFAFAAAVWGRQNYLVVLLAMPWLFFHARGFAWCPWVIVTLLGAAGAALLFGIWGGLVPEAVRFVSVGGGESEPAGVVAGLNIIFGIRSLAYAALALGILAPGVFKRDWRLVCLCGVGALVGGLIFEPMRFLPSAYLVSKILGESLLVPASILFGAGFAFLGFWLFASVVWNCWDLITGEPHGARGESLGLFKSLGRIGWNEKLYLFGAAAWLLILASNMKISHQFSSRYVVVAAPYLLITAIYHFRPTTSAFLRLICGFVVSMLLLANYYEWLG